jgi:8-oxo-dGTP pyrophosphatase MutT (NUDIX family)
MEKWTVLKEEDVSPSKWLPAVRHTVQLPNNKIVDDFFYCILGEVVIVIPFTADGNIVLVKQYKHGIGEVVIEFPAGAIQKNKTVAQTAIAELEEEAGIKMDESALISLGQMAGNPTKTYQVTHGFLVKNATFNAKQNFDENEEIELMICTPKEVIEMVKNGKIWVADHVSIIMKAYLLYPELFN